MIGRKVEAYHFLFPVSILIVTITIKTIAYLVVTITIKAIAYLVVTVSVVTLLVIAI